MFVTKRKYKEMEKDRDFEKLRADANMALWLEEWTEAKTIRKEMDITERSLDAAESALDYKEAVIEELQDDLYRMHCHHMAVRDMLLEAP